MKKLILMCVFCGILLCGCGNKYDTVVIGADDDSQISYDSNGGFSVFKDIGKEYKLFDNSRVVNAYLNNNTEELSELEADILNAAKEVLDEIKSNAETDYEIELAVHDYIVSSSTYDKKAIAAVGDVQENSENPYGILINKTGICLGYTTTFQLFMDMAEIPCITVYSEDDKGDEHAWNQVKIDGNWYYVDCTWNDPVPENVGRPALHDYFNVTEEAMEESGHRWNKEKCHEATSYEKSYYVMEAVQVERVEEIEKLVEQASLDEKAEIVIKTKSEFYDFYDIFRGGGKVAYYDSHIKHGDYYYIVYSFY